MKSVYEKEEAYWNGMFDSDDSMSILPYCSTHGREANADTNAAKVSMIRALPTDLSDRMNTLANGSDIALYMIGLAGATCLLHHYTNRENVLVGMPTMDESDDDSSPRDVLIMKTNLTRGSSFRSVLGSIKTAVGGALEHRHLPFRKMVHNLNLEMDTNGLPVMNTIVSYSAIHTASIDLSVSSDVIFRFDAKDDGLHLEVLYDESRYDASYIATLFEHFFRLLHFVLFQPDQPIGNAVLLSEDEKHRLLHEFNDVWTDFPRQATLHQFIEEHAERQPEAIAVSYEDTKLTYRELNTRANRLARTLRSEGVQPEALVGLMAERSIDMIVGMLAVLKAGGGYVAIDPEYPEERVRYMLEDSGARVILVQQHLQNRVPNTESAARLLILDDEQSYHEDASKLESKSTAVDLACVIYTSGTTGNPKGNLTTHRNIVRIVKNTNYIEITEQDKVLQLSSYSFDGSAFDIFGALTNGAQLVLVPHHTLLDARKLAELIETDQISVMLITTAYFNVLVDVNVSCLRHIRAILFGGERSSVAHVRKALEQTGPGRLKHAYGPSESTVYATWHDVTEIPERAVSVPIGRPISNTAIYIVNERNDLQPIGVSGELCVAGEGLVRGYLNRPELTAQKFVDNPFVPGERMYRTGDLARWLPDGTIEYVGRMDDQVKIRGHRIEIGEVEAQLLKVAPIQKATIVVRGREDGEKQLCAYYVADRLLPAGEIRTMLAKELPSYMIPAYFIQLEQMPLTTNGKVDRKALPEPEEHVQAETEYVAPRSEQEIRLARVWQEVLGLSRVGAKDHFFELGGHSLRATTLVSKLHKEENISLSLRDVFRNPTLEAMAALMEDAQGRKFAPIPTVEEKDVYPVSSVQKRLFILHQLEGAEQSYNMPGALLLEGDVDRNRLEYAFRQLITRHETLRTAFEMVNGEPVQRIYPTVDFVVEEMSALERSEVEEQIRQFIRAFDLSTAPLFRAGLIELAPERHILLFDMHHIISDGTSIGIMIEEFTSLYSGNELEPLRIQYKDFAAWQRSEEQIEQLKRQETYWLQQMEGVLPVLELPTDYVRPAVQSHDGALFEFSFDREQSQDLRKLAADTRTTLYMVLLAAYTIILHKYSGQEDIVVGTPIAGRTHDDVQPLIGMFVNTLAIRNYPSGSKSVLTYLEEIKETTLGAFEHQDYPFEELVENVQISRDMSRHPVFDTMFALENTEHREFDLDGLQVKPYGAEYGMAKFDLNLTVTEDGDGLYCTMEYATALYNRSTIERLCGHFLQVVGSMTHNPQAAISSLQMVTSEEKAQLQHEFNGTVMEYSSDKTVHELFAEQVERTPEAVAVVSGSEQLSYRDLNRKANQLAWKLREYGVSAEQPVGIIVERTLDTVVAVMAVLKASGTFVPIDPEYPETRIRYMLADSGAKLVLAQSELPGIIPDDVHLIDVRDESLYQGDGADVPNSSKPSNLLYIIYTSGTTGNPKGVMLEHGNMVNLLHYQQKGTNIPMPSRILQYASGSFDVCYQEMFSALLFGGSLYMVDNEMRKDPVRLFQEIEKHEIDVLFIPVAFLKFIFAEPEWAEAFPRCVRHIITAGEQLVVTPQVQACLKRLDICLHNHYGPSETHVVTTYTMTPEVIEVGLPPIGKPIANTSIYIVNDSFELQPIGVKGELFVSGACVGRGYWGRTDLTEEKFLDNPFVPGERLYKTGDVARWLPDGSIEYVGRSDHQVKIRGFRIELGEVESQLLHVPAVQEATVVALEDHAGQKQLCAYFTAERSLTAGEMRAALSQELPGYMIPSYFVQLERLPLTPNGKIDRRALPKPEGGIETGTEYVAPRTDTEARLARIWQDVLGLPSVGVKDNFFELGGHSLRATTLVSRLYKEMNVNFPLRGVFRHPTIEEMAKTITEMHQELYTEIPIAEEKSYYPLSSAQKRLFIVSQLTGAEVSYNMPGVLILEGELDRARFERAFQKLIDRHESLRTSFETVRGEPVQRIHSQVEFAIEYHLAAEQDAEALITHFVRPFQLNQAPLLRVGLIKTGHERHILMFDMHHIISDGVTMGHVVNEFSRIYAGDQLPALRIQYKDYAVWQQSNEYAEKLAHQESYWLKQLDGELPTLELPTDYVRPAVQQFEGDVALFTLTNSQAEQLQRLAANYGATLYMVLLAAYTVLLHKYTGQDDIIVGTPIAGRNHTELEPLVGMFVNTLAIRNYPTGEKSFAELLAEVKDTALAAFENQDYPFETLVEKVHKSRDMSRNPVFDTIFSLEHEQQSSFHIDGLRIIPYPHSHSVAKFDLTFHAEQNEEGILCGLGFATALYARETAGRMGEHFVQLIDAIIAEPNAKLMLLNMMSLQEREQVKLVFNDTITSYPREKTIQHLFEEQAEKSPDAIAVQFGEELLTYRELNERSNRLARTLRGKGVKAGRCVGLMTDRSLDMIVAIMATLKAGGAYVPIDPDYPEERIRYMIDDSGTSLLVVQRHLQANHIPADCMVVLVDDEGSYHADGTNLEQHNGASDLAYVIYTSGTTGMPKGNLTTHRNIVRVVRDAKYIEIDQHDTVLQLSSYAFDGSTFDIFGALLNGAKLVLITREVVLDAGRLADTIESEKISVMFITTAYFNLLVDLRVDSLRHMRAILFGGERASVSHVRKALRHLGPGKLKHVYGPTESTVFATSHNVDEVADSAVTIPIGRPIGNTAVYIVGEGDVLQPIGVAGELCVAGDGVAIGYLNRPDLSGAKFVNNPFVPGDRMYRTGDLARWLSDGTIEYVGRKDDQVKIRGYRIELGEVEAHLLDLEAIQEAVVIVREESDGQKRLCAYYVAGRPITAGEMRIALSQELPGYMLPSYFVQLDKLPLSPNGKVNRKALPAPELHVQAASEYVAPRTPQEVLLAHIWREVLGLGQVGVKDNFFELGGHSLSLMRLVERVYTETEIEIPIHSVFREPTIEAMAYEMLKSELAGKAGNHFMKLNENGHIPVFCFPPGLGYGLSYLELAKQLDHHCILHGIDFIDDAETREELLERYVNAILAVQPQPPFILLGYSLGGNLTFEVAKALECRGYPVSDVIMVDSLRKLKVHEVDEFDGDIDQMIDGVEELKEMLVHHPLLRDQVKNKMRAYWSYATELVNSDIIDANIHALMAEPSEVNQADGEQLAIWQEATRGRYAEYNLRGVHEEVLQPPFLEANANVMQAIIRHILEQTMVTH
ncbi:non-ribosomal peptide synthetase [Paenibacillus alvei]|uniref:non-ribosomal peptide synthetase n=1 Tax=Paenibacillus alvei TaxID=44250 RepID=UPI002282A28E|nr:non-ribosomal peptide synthetase [Paenibacillus alvei]